jgi:two-component system response regulator LytT
MKTKTMKILILEDEIPAYQKLMTCLHVFFSDGITHDWARSIKEGKDLLNDKTYDFILSDIQLLDGTSFDLFDSVSIYSPIIFCSAHDDYLFKAFKTNGIAYILKPYTQTDFNKAIEKYQGLFKQGDYNTLNHLAIDVLKSALSEENINYKKRFVIKKQKGIQLLNSSDISVVEASGDFCIATDNEGKRYTVSQNISSVYSQLNPKKYFKINRSELVHIDCIENIESHFKNRLLIKMKGLKETVMTSSSLTSEFRKWLEQ